MSVFEEVKKKLSYAASPEGLKETTEFLGLPSGEEIQKRQSEGKQVLNPLEVMGVVGRPIESVTAAPARAAISSLQGNLDLGEAMKAFANQFGRNPSLAPTGGDIAEKAGLQGKAAAAAGLGLDIAIDPTNLMGTAALKALPLIGLAGTVAKAEKAQALSKVLAAKDELGFYSKLEQVILEKMGKSATPEQVMSIAKGAKEEEVAASGLEQLLKGKDKVSKDEVLQQIRSQRPQLQEVIKQPKFTAEENQKYNELTLANLERELTAPEQLQLAYFENRGARGAQGAKFGQYVEPGGENYREVLITLPLKDQKAVFEAKQRIFEKFQPKIDELNRILNEAPHRWHEDAISAQKQLEELIEAREMEADIVMKLAQNERNFQSSHWDEPNVLAHARVNERVDEAGNKLFHVEEIQSDWHQQGRASGYRSDEKIAQLQAERTAIEEQINNLRHEGLPSEYEFDQLSRKRARDQDIPLTQARSELRQELSATNKKSYDELTAKYKDLNQKLAENINAIEDTLHQAPDAPFKKSWMEMTAKRMITQAVENGADRLSWTPGAKQAERYDLSKQIEQINLIKSDITGQNYLNAYDKNGEKVMVQVLDDISKLPDYIGKEAADRLMKQTPEKTNAGMVYKLQGQELSVGGEGMKGFYDKMLPDFLRKLGKKYGAQVGETTTNGMKVPFLELTPELKKAVKEEGLPLFKVGISAGLPALMERMRRDKESGERR